LRITSKWDEKKKSIIAKNDDENNGRNKNTKYQDTQEILMFKSNLHEED
jgi:hypothetical protein